MLRSNTSKTKPARPHFRSERKQTKMAKLTTPILIYATLTALFLLLLLRSTPQLPSSSYSPTRRHHRRLKLRSPSNSQHHHSIPFDPIVADIERHREDLYLTPPAPGHEASPEWEEFMDAEDYINDEKRFNMTDRLVLLFPSIDKNPRDGFLSVEELTEWNVAQTDKEILHRTERDLDAHDKNKDGFVSFEEYETPKWTPQVSGKLSLNPSLSSSSSSISSFSSCFGDMWEFRWCRVGMVEKRPFQCIRCRREWIVESCRVQWVSSSPFLYLFVIVVCFIYFCYWNLYIHSFIPVRLVFFIPQIAKTPTSSIGSVQKK